MLLKSGLEVGRFDATCRQKVLDKMTDREREKLWQYRESVWKHYTELQNGTREGLPKNLACPLWVGQRVIALHPESREVHDGSVLTVDHDKCRIQFDRPELWVALVKYGLQYDLTSSPPCIFETMTETKLRQMLKPIASA